MARDHVRDFKVQWRFLHASMQRFDETTDWAEAARIATTIRTFVHDTNRSTSLLRHMDLKDKLWFIASGGGVDPTNQSGTTSLTSMRFRASGVSSSFRYMPHNAKDMVAAYERQDWDWIRPATFEDWWTCPVIRSLDDKIFTRRDLVLLMANKDGGAHIDELTPAQEELKTGLNFGWGLEIGNGDGEDSTFDRIPVSPVEPSLRTIAAELDLSFFNQTDVLGFEYEGDPYVQSEHDYVRASEEAREARILAERENPSAQLP